jgi:DNA-binding CsgD family transcriptional regulator/tetratricopeptide (TPR) repeat protein
VLVGRRDERAALTEAHAGLAGGRGAVVLLTGEGGIGKSRLVEDFAASVADLSAVTGGCVDATTDALPYAPWTELLWWLRHDLGEDAFGPERARLARLLPELGEPAVVPAGEGDGDGRAMLFEAIVEALHRAASRRRLMCVVEDVHWIDRASRDVLLFVARNMRRLPLLLVVTSRPSTKPDVRDLFGQLERLGATRVDLRPLPDAEAADVASILTGEPVDAPAVRAVVQRAEGVPLFLEELVAALGDDALPSTVRHLMLSRFSALGADARRLVQTAAVIGARAPRALLVSASGLPGDSARAAAREVVEAGVLTSEDGGRGYAFAHSLLREAVLSELLPDERVAFHAAVAEALARRPRTRTDLDVVAELARHWDAAERPAEALKAAIAAAEHADRRYAFQAALTWYDRAQEWWREVDDPETVAGRTHTDLLFAHADAAGSAGALDRAAELSMQAIATIPGSEPSAGVEAFTRSRAHLWAVRRSDEVRELAAVALEHLDAVGTTARASFLVDYGMYLLYDSRPLEALELAPSIVSAVEAADVPAVSVNAHLLLGWCYELIGEEERADAEFRRATDAARANRLYPLLAAVVYNHASFYSSCPRRAECLARLDDVDALIAQHGIRRLLIAAKTLRADELVWAGSLDEATAVLDTVAEVDMEGVEVHAYGYSRALVALHAGDHGRALSLLDGARDTNDRGDDPARVMSHAFVRAEALAWLGRRDEAAALVDETLALMTGRLEPYWLGFFAMAAARVAADLATAGSSPAQTIARVWRESGRSLRGELPLTATQSLAIDAELATGPPRERAEAAHRAAGAFDAIAMPYYAAYFSWREAQALLDANDRRGSAALLTAARARAFEHGYAGLERAIEQTARTAQVPLGPRSDRVEELLSGREVEVLRLLAEGLSNPDIAEKLVIGRRTVRTHVSHILGKLGAASRTEAVTIAHRKGII